MKLKFKHQKFQAEATQAVCDVFSGQPFLSEANYLIDQGTVKSQTELYDFTGFKNHKLVPELSDKVILDNIRKIQRSLQIAPSDKLWVSITLVRFLEKVSCICLLCQTK